MISHANNADDAGNTSGNESGGVSNGSLPDASRRDSPNRDLGGRRVCQKCGEKYYDLGKASIICPNPECGATFDPEVLLKSRRIKLQAATKADSKPNTTSDADASGDNDADLAEEYDGDSDVDAGDIPPVTSKTSDNDNDE